MEDIADVCSPWSNRGEGRRTSSLQTSGNEHPQMFVTSPETRKVLALDIDEPYVRHDTAFPDPCFAMGGS